MAIPASLDFLKKGGTVLFGRPLSMVFGEGGRSAETELRSVGEEGSLIRNSGRGLNDPEAIWQRTQGSSLPENDSKIGRGTRRWK